MKPSHESNFTHKPEPHSQDPPRLPAKQFLVAPSFKRGVHVFQFQPDDGSFPDADFSLLSYGSRGWKVHSRVSVSTSVSVCVCVSPSVPKSCN